VGFIRKLPHSLVTSFRATLEEVQRAELLLHVRDAASPLLEEQRVEVEAVLAELDVQNKPTLQVFNKTDLLAAGAATPMPSGAVPVSALKGEGLARLLNAIDAALTADPLLEVRFRIPQAEGRVIAAIERGATISHQKFQGNIVYFTAIGPTSLMERYRRFWQREGAPAAHGADETAPETAAEPPNSEEFAAAPTELAGRNNTGRLSGERR
jgi:GTP-binding protein HflX